MNRIAIYGAAACRGVWFAGVLTAVTAGAWMFGAWEMWWFWGFTSLLALTMLAGGLSILLLPAGHRPPLGAAARRALAACVPLLLYSTLRAARTPVAIDAERSLLLLVIPVALAVTTAWLATPRQSRILFALILLNTAAIAAYGRINHMLNGSTKILWAEGFPQYYLDGRASAPFYCPDHYAGLLELGLCMALGLLLARRIGGLTRGAASLTALLMLTGIMASKSRGGLFTVVIIAIGVLVWGFAQWPRQVRGSWRLLLACLLLLGSLAIIPLAAHGPLARTLAYPPLRAMAHGDFSGLHDAARQTPRYHMYSAAWRSWLEHPTTGIGAGMHPHIWPRFAASADGNRDTRTWPSFTNTRNYSYKVHSDWLQLLQEYGLIGLLLMLWATTSLFRALASRLRETADAPLPSPAFPPALTALLALAALCFHSLGDFNLQIPAIGWTLATLIGLGLGHTTGVPYPPHHPSLYDGEDTP